MTRDVATLCLWLGSNKWKGSRGPEVATAASESSWGMQRVKLCDRVTYAGGHIDTNHRTRDIAPARVSPSSHLDAIARNYPSSLPDHHRFMVKVMVKGTQSERSQRYVQPNRVPSKILDSRQSILATLQHVPKPSVRNQCEAKAKQKQC